METKISPNAYLQFIPLIFPYSFRCARTYSELGWLISYLRFMILGSENISTAAHIIQEEIWFQQKNAHEQRVDGLLNDYLEARSRQEKNPVVDFLFEYYAFRPANLRRWSPGIGVYLEFTHPDGLPEISELKMEGNHAWINPLLFPEKRIQSLRWTLEMLINTRSKRPSFGCFGMHEWAMVYKSKKPRHNQIPLRMKPAELADFVESRPLLCTHFDAFRFFTEDAKPLNKFELSRAGFNQTEQPGCIHTNMDLYKWAFKIYPWISSDLILEAFEFALEARTIDMQASPYDLRGEGLEPIKIETEAGRVLYKQKQEAIFRRGAPLRERLIAEYQKLISSFAG